MSFIHASCIASTISSVLFIIVTFWSDVDTSITLRKIRLDLDVNAIYSVHILYTPIKQNEKPVIVLRVY